MSKELRIETLDNGGLMEIANLEMEKILANILDPNTPATGKRELIITISAKPTGSDRNFFNVAYTTKLKLQAPEAVSIPAFVDMDRKTKKPVGVELMSGENHDQHILPGNVTSIDEAKAKTAQ